MSIDVLNYLMSIDVLNYLMSIDVLNIICIDIVRYSESIL